MKQFFKAHHIVGIIGIVIAVGVLIGLIIGFNSDTSDQSTTASNAAPETTNAAEPSGREFVFEQLGFTINEPNGLAGLNYVQVAGASADGQRYLVTSDAFKAAAKACGQDPSKSYFASVFKSLPSAPASSIAVTINGQSITIGNGQYGPECSGSEEDSFNYTDSLSQSKKLLETALQQAR